jgi:hypothetical protein
MARPWIEFLFAQHLPWQRGLPGGARTDVDCKILSIDAGAGDMSAICRYPPGWSRAETEALRAEEEVFVLDGEIQINGHTYRRDSYACLPAGYPRSGASSAQGCVVLAFFSAVPERCAPTDDHAARQVIEGLNSYEMKWDDSTADPKLAWMGNRRKVLRWDHEHDQKGTFILATPPHIFPENWAGPTETHACAEEVFVLAGDSIGPLGQMTPGAYFWRPEGKPHGPFGSRDGGCSLIRFKYGKHANIWGSEDVPYSFDFPYRPMLPPELARYGKAPYVGIERY